jgi:hypothetical protein
VCSLAANSQWQPLHMVYPFLRLGDVPEEQEILDSFANRSPAFGWCASWSPLQILVLPLKFLLIF